MREQLTESDVKKIEEEIQHRKHVIRRFPGQKQILLRSL